MYPARSSHTAGKCRHFQGHLRVKQTACLIKYDDWKIKLQERYRRENSTDDLFLKNNMDWTDFMYQYQFFDILLIFAISFGLLHYV